MFKSLSIYKRKGLDKEMVLSNGFKVWQKSIGNGSGEYSLKFLVNQSRRKAVNHIYCPMIIENDKLFDNSSKDSFIHIGKITGTFNPKINSLEIYSPEECLRPITKQPHDNFQNQSLSNLLKSYLTYIEHPSQIKLNIYKKEKNGIDQFIICPKQII
mmetsp:Transcript_6106/g.5254  ORF Transcript_6106/g.5254 Transcript_6106/m.5254 type:complete len:157 (+) Transcript_6106:111-581(+)